MVYYTTAVTGRPAENLQAMPETSSAPQFHLEPKPAAGALTRTGGFLTGFTHTLQPYIGCRFGCAYCYVQGLSVHHFQRNGRAWGDYVYPRTGIADRLAAELTRLARRGQLTQTAIFMSSTTDPYQGAERVWGLTRLPGSLGEPAGAVGGADAVLLAGSVISHPWLQPSQNAAGSASPWKPTMTMYVVASRRTARRSLLGDTPPRGRRRAGAGGCGVRACRSRRRRISVRN
ncbi:MAG: hypothetical protein R2873_12705 [Caldilineaceae bacterium]